MPKPKNLFFRCCFFLRWGKTAVFKMSLECSWSSFSHTEHEACVWGYIVPFRWEGEVSHKGLLVQMKNRLKHWSCGSGSVWVQMTCDPQSLFLGKREWMDDFFSVLRAAVRSLTWHCSVICSHVISHLLFFSSAFCSLKLFSPLILMPLLFGFLLSSPLSFPFFFLLSSLFSFLLLSLLLYFVFFPYSFFFLVFSSRLLSSFDSSNLLCSLLSCLLQSICSPPLIASLLLSSPAFTSRPFLLISLVSIII